MNSTSETNATGNGADFDPRAAAAELDQATAHARRAFAPVTPSLLLYRAALLLIVGGGFWLSVRGQRPYTGPTAATGAVMGPVTAVLVIINIIWTAVLIRRAGTGVDGPAQRRWRAGLAVMLVTWIIAIGALAPDFHKEVTFPVWGLYPASGPMLIAGGVALITAVVLRNGRLIATCLAITAVSAAAGFAGPVGEWLVMGAGLCGVMLAAAAYLAWSQRRTTIQR